MKFFLDFMGGGAWPFLVGGVICLVDSVNERDLGQLNGLLDTSRYLPLCGTIGGKRKEVRGNNRSVMPLDVLGHTRATLIRSSSFFSWPRVWVIFSNRIVLGIDYCNY